MDSLYLSLAGDWLQPGGHADRPIGRVEDRVLLRIGPHSLLAHAAPQPVAPFLLHACRALIALAAGARERVTIPLSGEAGLALVADGPHLRVTMTAAEGPVLLHGASVPARPFARSVVRAVRAFTGEAHPFATAPGERVLIAALERAATTLGTLPTASKGAPVTRPRPRSAPTPASGPLALRFREGALQVTLGEHRVDVPQTRSALVARNLVGLMQALLQTRDWPPGFEARALDPQGDRSLLVHRGGAGLFVTLVDVARNELAPAQRLELSELSAAAWRCLAALPGEVEVHRRAFLRLIRWERALRNPVTAAAAPAGWRGMPTTTATPDPPPLPVSGLHHLAYRRTWRREAPGLIRVEAEGSHLLIFDDAGLTSVLATTGERRWVVPAARPLATRGPGLVADDEGRLMRVDRRRGRILWRVATGEEGPFRAAWPVRTGWIATSETTMFGLAEGGALRWRYDTCFGQIVGCAVHGPLAWMTADDGLLHGVRLADGTPQFVLPLLGEPESAPLLSPAGLIVITTREPVGRAVLARHDPITGALRWRTQLPGPARAAPIVVEDQVLQLLGADGHLSLECRGLADGALRWRRRDLPLLGRPRMLRHEDLLCVKAPDGAVVALELADGGIRWVLPPDDADLALLGNPLPVARRGLLLVPGVAIRVLDPGSGRLIQTLDCAELVPEWLHVWPDGDLAIAEDQAVARYALGGHLALVR